MLTVHAAAAKVARESKYGDMEAIREARQELAFVKLSRTIEKDQSNGVYMNKKQVKHLIDQLKETLS